MRYAAHLRAPVVYAVHPVVDVRVAVEAKDPDFVSLSRKLQAVRIIVGSSDVRDIAKENGVCGFAAVGVLEEIQLLLSQDQESLVPKLLHETTTFLLDLGPAILDDGEIAVAGV